MNAVTMFKLKEIEDEPRVLDTDLGAALGMAQPLNIRKSIQTNADELASYGGFHAARENSGRQGGRPSAAYWLNEPQALLLCMFARTPKAAQVRKLLIETFMQWRQQRLTGHAGRLAIATDYPSRLAMLEARVAQLEAGGGVRPRLPPVMSRDAYYHDRIVQFVRDYGGVATKTELWHRLPHYFKAAQINAWLDALISAGRLRCSVELRGYSFASVYCLPD